LWFSPRQDALGSLLADDVLAGSPGDLDGVGQVGLGSAGHGFRHSTCAWMMSLHQIPIRSSQMNTDGPAFGFLDTHAGSCRRNEAVQGFRRWRIFLSDMTGSFKFCKYNADSNAGRGDLGMLTEIKKRPRRVLRPELLEDISASVLAWAMGDVFINRSGTTPGPGPGRIRPIPQPT
jgi:hypothetical protein